MVGTARTRGVPRAPVRMAENACGMSLAAPTGKPECTPTALNRSGYAAATIAAAAPPAPPPHRPLRVAYVFAAVLPVVLLATLAVPLGLAWAWRNGNGPGPAQNGPAGASFAY